MALVRFPTAPINKLSILPLLNIWQNRDIDIDIPKMLTTVYIKRRNIYLAGKETVWRFWVGDFLICFKSSPLLSFEVSIEAAYLAHQSAPWS